MLVDLQGEKISIIHQAAPQFLCVAHAIHVLFSYELPKKRLQVTRQIVLLS